MTSSKVVASSIICVFAVHWQIFFDAISQCDSKYKKLSCISFSAAATAAVTESSSQFTENCHFTQEHIKIH